MFHAWHGCTLLHCDDCLQCLEVGIVDTDMLGGKMPTLFPVADTPPYIAHKASSYGNILDT